MRTLRWERVCVIHRCHEYIADCFVLGGPTSTRIDRETPLDDVKRCGAPLVPGLQILLPSPRWTCMRAPHERPVVRGPEDKILAVGPLERC